MTGPRALFRAVLLFALGGLALALSSCSFAPEEPASLASLFPQRVEGLRLDQLLTGDEARQAVDRLHSKAIPMEDAAIGHYVGAPGPMAVWISRAGNAAGAREQVAVMLEKMVRMPGSPFGEPAQREAFGTRVWVVPGMGQEHAICSVGQRVYWIGADPAALEAALAAFLGPEN
jgi:hypothetical protein